MDVYHGMIELKDKDNSLGFAAAAKDWFDYLLSKDLILSWRLLRRKFGLASSDHTDFIIELEVENMASLEDTFARLSTIEDEPERKYRRMHNMIEQVKVGLYRSYPDPIERERISVV